MAAYNILVIDDDPSIARLIDYVLSAKGYSVRTANESRRGLALALSAPPDLILLDFMMPGKDGMELLADMRAIPELENIPVIMVTAQGVSEVVSQAVQYRISSFIVKPFSVAMLVERVMKLLPLETEAPAKPAAPPTPAPPAVNPPLTPPAGPEPKRGAE
jgi:DNA-binding response OmpR family regulator